MAHRTRFAPTYEQLAYAGLVLFALLTHLWGLGDRALHHDETLHAAYSWRLYTGQGFIHDPLLHGPFLYHIVALMYFLFGDNDFTARLSVADERRATIKSSAGAGLTLTFQVPEIQAAWQWLDAQGAKPGPLRRHAWGAQVFYLYDPEGHRLEFWSPETV